jgi:type I pantothenate kinase
VSTPAPATEYSPYIDFDRAAWSRLSESTPLPLTEADVRRLRGLGDPIELSEVDTIYRPLSRLLSLYVTATSTLHRASSTFLGEAQPKTPYVIGVAGSVAVGKSTTSRILREMMARWPETPHVELVTTDGFLFPNAVLEDRGLMKRKGFPETYNRRALLNFVRRVKAGEPEVTAPVYSHTTYDIVPGEQTVVHQPDVLIIEGLNVMQPSRPGTTADSYTSVSDYFDFSIYVDARTRDIRKWYVERFMTLRETAFTNPDNYFHQYASLDDDSAIETALSIWESINAPNLVQNIAPTKGRATLQLTKGEAHSIQRVRLRKL